MTQTTLQVEGTKGRRTSAYVPKGTSPAEAIKAARAAKDFEKPPQHETAGKVRLPAAGAGVPEEDPSPEADDDLPLDDVDVPEGAEEGEGEPDDDGEPGDERDDARPRGEKTLPGLPTIDRDEKGRAKLPSSKGNWTLKQRFQAFFFADTRPDAPLDAPVKNREQSARDAYLIESRRVVETALAKSGRLRAPNGRFAKTVSMTASGAVQYRSAKGRIIGVARAPYRAEKGQFKGNVERPFTPDRSLLTQAVDRRLEAVGKTIFGDRAGLSPARLHRMRQAFVADRKRRGWTLPDWPEAKE